jgi:hypothetical protein
MLKSAHPWLAAGLALLMLSPNIAWNVAHDFPTLKHTADITVNKVAAGGLGQLGEFWAAQWIALGPILGSVLFWLFIRVDRSWRDERTRLLLWFSLPLWLIVSAQALNSGANANWAAPAFAPAAIAVVAWLLQGKHPRWLIGALIFNLLLVGLVYHWPMLLAAVNVENPAKKSPYSRARGWDELGRQLVPFVAAHPAAILLADNRTLLAHMRYELRALQPQAISWNPEGQAGDHYKLTTDLRPQLGRDMLFISRDPLGEEITRCFTESRLLAELKAPLDRQTTLDMKVYWLHDFKGY